jgi:ElaB/YqjD/DUF883 family membrane-anchored ribosome-binding protein
MSDLTQALNEATSPQRDKLMGDLKVLISDAEELLKATAGQTSNGAAALRGRVMDTLERAKATLADRQAEAVERARAAGRMADDYVHDNPWKSIGVAAGIGLLVGALLTSRR